MSETFWLFLVSSGCALLLAISRILYKSKCKEIECGCLKIVRDVQTEEKEFEISSMSGNINTSNEVDIEKHRIGFSSQVT